MADPDPKDMYHFAESELFSSDSDLDPNFDFYITVGTLYLFVMAIRHNRYFLHTV